jgi:hypothetical protein
MIRHPPWSRAAPVKRSYHANSREHRRAVMFGKQRLAEPLTAESTKPVAEVRTHAGIVKVKRYALDIS